MLLRAGTLTIQKMLRVGRELHPLFAAVGLNPEGTYLDAQVAQCFDKYVAAQKLNSDAKGAVELNKDLGDALYKVRPAHCLACFAGVICWPSTAVPQTENLKTLCSPTLNLP